jgi:hypothetical protein
MSGAQRRNVETVHFRELTFQERKAAIVTLAADGMSDYGISAATGIAVEQVRAIIGERARHCEGCDE